MRLTIEAKQITTEFWLATLRISEEGKMDNMREFVVNEQQLAFLGTVVGFFGKQQP